MSRDYRFLLSVSAAMPPVVWKAVRMRDMGTEALEGEHVRASAGFAGWAWQAQLTPDWPQSSPEELSHEPRRNTILQ